MPIIENSDKQHSKMKVVDVRDLPVVEKELVSIYRWLDTLEFSRAKKTSAHRDFADGVLMAELVAIYIPKIVNTRNYTPASSSAMKISNWELLNSIVFRRIKFHLTSSIIQEIANSRPGMIERVLLPLRLILLRGSKAVTSPSTKLENVKSRYLDERYFVKPTPQEELPVPKPVIRPRPLSRLGSSSSRSRASSPPPFEIRRATTPKPRLSRSRQKYVTEAKPTTASEGIQVPPPEEEVTPLKRPSTTRANIHDEDIHSRKDEDDSDSASALLRMKSVEDDDVDDVIYCSAELEDDDSDEQDVKEKIIYEQSRGHPRSKKKSSSPKRKIKRVVKYEIREEYILNGMAYHQLPNEGDVEEVRTSYMSPGNRDPKCRGYGFV